MHVFEYLNMAIYGGFNVTFIRGYLFLLKSNFRGKFVPAKKFSSGLSYVFFFHLLNAFKAFIDNFCLFFRDLSRKL